MKKLKLMLLGVVSIAVLSFGFNETVTKDYSVKKEADIQYHTEPGMGI